MKSVLAKHPIAAYFLIAFGWTWLIAFTMLFTGLADDVTSPSFPFVLCGILSGIAPSIAALIVSRAKGKDALKSLTGRMKIKGKNGWTLITLLIVPAITIATTLISHFVIREYRFTFTAPVLIMGLVWPLFACLGEEFGWRGFLLPRLIKRFGVMKSAFLLGIIWEIWHLPMHYMLYRTYGAYMIPAFLTVGFLNLTLNAVIMAIIYAMNNGSLRLMVFYHYTITASAIILGALYTTQASPRGNVLETLLSCSLFAIAALVLYLKNRHHLAAAAKENVAC